jgi:hypothetical protein
MATHAAISPDVDPAGLDPAGRDPAGRDWTQLDQRIIDCFVADGEPQLGALSKDGGGEIAIRSRAKALGLTNEFIKRCRLNDSQPALRGCMKCDAEFLSWGVQNRLCRRCTPK